MKRPLRPWTRRSAERGTETLEHQRDAVTMGRFSYGNPVVRTYAGDSASVSVGAFTSIADGAEFIPGGNHRVDWVTTYPLRYVFGLPGALEDGHPASKGDIVVGNDVWIGTGARVMSGVKIGDGAVVAAGSVVTRDVDPYWIVAGNPARPRRRRFTDVQVEALLETAWWEWPEEVIADHVELLCGDDIDAFITFARRIRRPSTGTGAGDASKP